MKYNLIINDREFDVEVGAVQDGYAQVYVNDEFFEVDIANFQEASPPAPRRPQAAARQSRPASSVVPRQMQPAAKAPIQAPPPKQAKPAAKPPAPAQAAKTASPKTSPASGTGAIKAPMPGLILDIKVKVGDAIKAGQVVAVMEAMKMENDLPSGIDGTVKEICIQKGAQVATGDVLIVVG